MSISRSANGKKSVLHSRAKIGRKLQQSQKRRNARNTRQCEGHLDRTLPCNGVVLIFINEYAFLSIPIEGSGGRTTDGVFGE